MKTSTYPFDLTNLAKGSWISPERCEEVAQCKRDDKRYSLRLLSLRTALEESWRREFDEVITTRTEGDGIRIVVDDEAIDVNDRRAKKRVRGLESDLHHLAGIDREKLTSDERREEQEKKVTRWAAFVAGGKRAASAARLKPHKRGTPLIGK